MLEKQEIGFREPVDSFTWCSATDSTPPPGGNTGSNPAHHTLNRTRVSNREKETETVTTPQDPFANPHIPPSTHPSIGSFRGRLVMIVPKRHQTVPDNLNAGQTKDRITADVTVLDGLGPVPLVKGNPPQPTGQTLPGPDFLGVWFESSRVVEQLLPELGTGRPVLAVIDVRNPGQHPGKGNPYGLVAATDQQRAQAIQFLAQRSVGGAATPAPMPQQAPAPAPQQQYAPQPVAQHYANVQAQQPYYAPQPAPVAAPPAAPQYAAQAQPPIQQAPAPQPAPNPLPPVAAPGSAGPGANPFAVAAPPQQ